MGEKVTSVTRPHLVTGDAALSAFGSGTGMATANSLAY
jgi:hypothetical protein